MQSNTYLSSKVIFVVFVVVLLGCLLIVACSMPLNALDAIISPVWFLWCVTGAILVVKMVGYVKKEYPGKKKPKSDRFKNFPFKSFVCFFGSIFVITIFNYGMKSAACERVKAFLNKVSPDTQVYINGQQIKETGQIIIELKKVTMLVVGGSHTTKRIPIEIVSHDETLTLVLGRDSRYPQQYWVFYPRYRYTSKNDIGRIKTSLFDHY